jgi:hypothetical protein
VNSELLQLHADLDRVLRGLRSLYSRTAQMEQQGRLGSAARVPDELARAIPCVAACRNAIGNEAFNSMIGAPR